MGDEIVYMLGVIGVGFLVNYTLRALPFILFSGRDRALPRWVEKLGGVISPLIIALLIVYAYSGSAWRTAWPYLAGLVTVGLQIWKRNPLLSIVAGTVLYMVMLNCCGCATRTVHELDGANPELLLRSDGVYMGTKKLEANKIVVTLQDAQVPKTQAIHIKVEGSLKDLRASSALMALLARGGYTRSVLVTEQHGESDNKSGDGYKGSERMMRQDDVMFTLTRESGLRFGLLTPVRSADVIRCLEDHGVQTNQLVRMCGKVEDYGSADIQEAMDELEGILRKANYTNVKRTWMGDPKRKGLTAGRANRPAGSRPTRQQEPPRPKTPTGIRFTAED